MRHRFHFVLLSISLASLGRAEFPTSQPYQGVAYSHVTLDDPQRPQSLYIVTVDLRDPRVKVRVVPGGADPDGKGEWQTTLMTVREIAARENFDVAINASFFGITRPKDAGEIAEEKSEKAAAASGNAAPATTSPATTSVGYRAGVWSKSVGWAMTDGKLWSPERNPEWPTFWIDSRGRGHIGEPKNVPTDAKQLVQGNVWLLKGGKVVEPKGNAKVRHPRTVVGLDASGTKLTLLTIDGRRPGIASGMDGPEMAEQMLRLGCTNAINLDGGGSTTLVMREPESDELRIINQPSDGRLRPVADVIGISVGNAK